MIVIRLLQLLIITIIIILSKNLEIGKMKSAPFIGNLTERKALNK